MKETATHRNTSPGRATGTAGTRAARPAPRAATEAALHAQVALYLRYALMPPAWFSTIGHGGGGRVRGAILKRAGMRPGMPDLLVFGANGYVLGIELKAGKGKQSPEQAAVAEDMRTCGQGYTVCRSIDDVATALRTHGFPVRAVMRRAA